MLQLAEFRDFSAVKILEFTALGDDSKFVFKGGVFMAQKFERALQNDE